jgi:TrbC/VIRB2 pilin
MLLEAGLATLVDYLSGSLAHKGANDPTALIASRYGPGPTKYWTRIMDSDYFPRHVNCGHATRAGGQNNDAKTHFRYRNELAAALLRGSLGLGTTLLLAGNAFAQTGGTSPWENAVNVLQTAFTGPIAKGLALVAIVVGGLTFAFEPSR